MREQMIRRRRELDDAAIRNASVNIIPRVLDFAEQMLPQSADRELTIMSYMSFGQEFPTAGLNRSILEKGWRLVLPYTDRNFNITACVTSSLENLRRSSMGILEPDPAISLQITASDADLILLPGIAFDRTGMRLGFGKGCYDRFLVTSGEKKPLTAALAWSFQIVKKVPCGKQDLACDYLFTEKELIPACRKIN